MIVGKFAAYTKEQVESAGQDLDAEPGSWNIFNLLTLPFFSFTGEKGPRIGTDKDRPRKLKKIKRAFRPLMHQEATADRTTRSLRYEGGEVVLEDEEFKVLKAVWDELRPTLDVSMNEIAVAVDEWLDDVANYTPTEWLDELEKRAAAKTEPAAS